MSEMVLVIGSKALSSWSMRPWLALKAVGLPFREELIRFGRPDTTERIRAVSPSGKVPLLRHGGLTVWDSIAICEYAAELAPGAGLWPADRAARAVARAVSAEMHSGFAEVRRNLPMDLKNDRGGTPRTAQCDAEAARIQALWADCRERFGAGGPFLFGSFTIADCMYAPVVTRFRTYGVPLTPAAAAYSEAVLAHPPVQEWYAAARLED